MARLITWANYRAELCLDKKEPFETYSWMTTRREEFESMYQALQAENATEWLKNYPPPDIHFLDFNEPIAHRVHEGFKGRSGGSFISFIKLLRQYQYALQDWDNCVIAIKTNEARIRYAQLVPKNLARLNNLAYLAIAYQSADAKERFQKEMIETDGSIEEKLIIVQELYQESLEAEEAESDGVTSEHGWYRMMLSKNRS